MTLVHEPTVLAAARRPGTRRGLVGGGALALAALAAAAAPGGRAARAQANQAGGQGRGDGYTDLEVLNYALTLEHLEYAFYRDGLERFSKQAFKRAGFGGPTYRRPFTNNAPRRYRPTGP